MFDELSKHLDAVDAVAVAIDVLMLGIVVGFGWWRDGPGWWLLTVACACVCATGIGWIAGARWSRQLWRRTW